MDVIKGKTWTFGKNIDTDVIIPGRYLRTFNPQDLADHVLEGERPDFTQNVKKGDVIGQVGNTGNVKTPQLHFEVRKGTKASNPINYLKN